VPPSPHMNELPKVESDQEGGGREVVAQPASEASLSNRTAGSRVSR
jgi:hypothetical protein